MGKIVLTSSLPFCFAIIRLMCAKDLLGGGRHCGKKNYRLHLIVFSVSGVADYLIVRALKSLKPLQIAWNGPTESARESPPSPLFELSNARYAKNIIIQFIFALTSTNGKKKEEIF